MKSKKVLCALCMSMVMVVTTLTGQTMPAQAGVVENDDYDYILNFEDTWSEYFDIDEYFGCELYFTVPSEGIVTINYEHSKTKESLVYKLSNSETKVVTGGTGKEKPDHKGYLTYILKPGTYCFEIMAKYEDVEDAIRVKASFKDYGAPISVSDTMTAPTPLSLDTEVKGVVTADNKYDYYSINIPETGYYNVNAMTDGSLKVQVGENTKDIIVTGTSNNQVLLTEGAHHIRVMRKNTTDDYVVYKLSMAAVTQETCIKHNYRVTNKWANLYEEGYREYKCMYCGYVYRDSITAREILQQPDKAKVTFKGKNIKVYRKKVTRSSQVSSMQIRYSTDKKFKKGVKTLTVKRYKKKTNYITKVKKKKTYFVQLRYVHTEAAGTVYSKWTKSYKVKTK